MNGICKKINVFSESLEAIKYSKPYLPKESLLDTNVLLISILISILKYGFYFDEI